MSTGTLLICVRFLGHPFNLNTCLQSPNCGSNRPKRDAADESDDGHPATIEVYSGLYVNENAEIIDGDDSVFAEKVSEQFSPFVISGINMSLTLCFAVARRRTVRVSADIRHCHRRRRPHPDAGRRRGRAVHHGPSTPQDGVAFGQFHLQRPVHEYSLLAQQLSGFRPAATSYPGRSHVLFAVGTLRWGAHTRHNNLLRRSQVRPPAFVIIGTRS